MVQNSNKIQTAKYVPPPPDLPIYQHIDPKKVSFIGRTNYEAPLESKKYVFGIKRADRREHIYIIGKSGVGKSKLIELLARQDIAYGYGLCVIDPHGDIIEPLLDFIPQERVEEVIIIDPFNYDFSILINPLDYAADDFKHQIVQDFSEIIKEQLSSEWNASCDRLFRFSTMAILDQPDRSISKLIYFLRSSRYRQEVLSHIKSAAVQRFFSTEFNSQPSVSYQEAAKLITSKLEQLLILPPMRNILAFGTHKVDFYDALTTNKIILVNLAEERVGKDTAKFLGSIILMKLKHAALERLSDYKTEAKDFYLYIDEFNLVSGPAFMGLFNEARRCKIPLTIAHQHLSQLSSEIIEAVLGNVAHIITFRVSGRDAKVLEPEMSPVIKAKDMLNLGAREFYIKETINGQSYDPFSADTLTVMPPPYPSIREMIVGKLKEKYQ